MENNYYLSLGTKVGGHYEIEKVLGEDEFEILYLAKDLHKRGEFIILKELFFKSYSTREENNVKTLAKSKIIFEETKKEVMAEVNELLNNPPVGKIQTYGTFEENNTIYTIMEFVNSSNLDGYLKVEREVTTEDKPQQHINKETIEKEESVDTNVTQKDVMKEEIIEPIPKKPLQVEKKKKPKSSLFLNILITTLLICIGLGYYAYNMIKEDKAKAKAHTTTVVEKEEPKQKSGHLGIEKEDIINDNLEEPQEVEQEKEEETQTPEGAAYITDVETYKKEQEAKRAEEEAEQRAKEEAERKVQEKEDQALRQEEERRLQEATRIAEKEEIVEEETSNHPENDVPSPFKEEQKENLPLGAGKSNSLGRAIGNENQRGDLLGTPIGDTTSNKNIKEQSNRETSATLSEVESKKDVKQFLDKFLTISESGTIDEIVDNYDEEVGRYFSLHDVNHDTIRQDKINYHKRWAYREFDMRGFEISKVYQRDGKTYYDVKTTTNWSVADGKGKSVAGTSKGVMTLRKTEDGFKVTSIYSK